MESIHRFAKNGHSQNGEWGIIEEALKRMGFVAGENAAQYTAVEFGAADGVWCSNTYDLVHTYRGWLRFLFDVNPGSIEVAQATITPENVNIILPGECKVLSIDVDGNDALIWHSYKGVADLVVIEINSSLDPQKDVFSPEQGANYSYMKKLGESKGYFLLCHTGNLIFVLNKYKELFPDADETFKTDWL